MAVRNVQSVERAQCRAQRLDLCSRGDVSHAVVLLAGPRKLVAPDPVRLIGRDGGRERDAGLGAGVHHHPINIERRLAVAHEHAAIAQAREILGAARVGRVGVRRAARRQVDLGPREVEEARGPVCRERAPRRCSRRRRAARSRRPRSRRSDAARRTGGRGTAKP